MQLPQPTLLQLLVASGELRVSGRQEDGILNGTLQEPTEALLDHHFLLLKSLAVGTEGLQRVQQKSVILAARHPHKDPTTFL